MTPSFPKIMLSLILSATLCCATAWTQEIPKPDSYACLSAKQKDAINICFDENDSCHKSLHSAAMSGSSDWTYFFAAIGLGVIGGIVLAAQMRK